MWMRVLITISLIGFATGCLADAPFPLHPSTTQTLPIINGQADSRHPAVGAITVGTRDPFCTGTLIASKIVVTAAHCVDAFGRFGGPSGCRFRTDLNGSSTHHVIAQAIKHPNYNPRSPNLSDYDIAVLILANRVTGITPITANQDPLSPAWVGRKLLIMGYGLISTVPKQPANTKQSADIPMHQVEPKQFIHYDQHTQKSGCHGDSGGPALYQFGSDWRVIGVTSTAYKTRKNPSGDPPTLCDGGTVDTRVDVHYTSFLLPYIQQHGGDCQDGQTRPCYTGPPDTRDIGICKSGIQTCQGGTWSQTCANEVLPASQETCDGVDNNCNKQTDEGCCQHGTTETCYSGPPQTKGIGVCESGQRTCTNGQWGPCEGEIPPQSQEICGNQKDDNCNGQVDEGCGPKKVCEEGTTRTCYSGPDGTLHVGICRAGSQRCAAGQWGQCFNETKPTTERCDDKLDNNCDGNVDEGCNTPPNNSFHPGGKLIARGFGCSSHHPQPLTPWLGFLSLLPLLSFRQRNP